MYNNSFAIILKNYVIKVISVFASRELQQKISDLINDALVGSVVGM